MIADAPYEIRGLPLSFSGGILAGVFGSILMIGIAHALGLRSGPGLAGHLAVGGLLGGLYAICQQRIASWALIGVGIFYGVLLWVAGRIMLGWLLHTSFSEAIRSTAWLAACCGYGFWLALCAIWAASRQSPEAMAVLRD